MIRSFNRGVCRTVSAKVEAALAPLAEELGLEISTKGGSYSTGCYTLKIECATVNADGSVQTKEATDFSDYAEAFGLSPSDLGRSFERDGESWKIVGLKPRSRKYPIVCSRSDGRTYKLPASSVKLHLAAAAK